ncbi:MAG: FAD-binding protein, partial [Betaproteobacteria bacterium]|nr:FAD-binding protein [Betaproteobacteria bacterium]
MHGNCDVVVVGSGNAASCAALSARESGAKVVIVEAAPYEARGGNTAYAGGNMRVVFRGIEDLLKIISDLTDEEIRNTEFGTYTAEDFFDDMGRITQYRCDPDLVEYLYVEQIENQKEIFYGVLRYNMAHVVMMCEQGVFSREDSEKLLTGLKEIESLGVEGFPLDPEYQGVHPCIEADLVRRYGYEVGGKILTGRSRGDVHN